MITVNENQTCLRKFQRQFSFENLRLSNEIAKKDKMYAEAVQEIRRFNLEPSTPPPPTDMDVEFKKISKLYLEEQGKRIESDQKIRRNKQKISNCSGNTTVSSR